MVGRGHGHRHGGKDMDMKTTDWGWGLRRTGRKGEVGRQTQGGIRQGKDPIRGPIVVNLPAYLG